MIFYFSATGNNQRIAELLAKGANEDMVPIASALKNGRFRYSLNNRENLGFVIPVYFYTTPQPVIDFVEQLEISGAADCYTYIVVSYGTHTGKAGIRLASLLKKKGISADALYSVRTVDTFLPEFDIPEGAALERVLDSADRQTAVIKAEIARRARGAGTGAKGSFRNWCIPFPDWPMKGRATPPTFRSKRRTVSDAVYAAGSARWKPSK